MRFGKSVLSVLLFTAVVLLSGCAEESITAITDTDPFLNYQTLTVKLTNIPQSILGETATVYIADDDGLVTTDIQSGSLSADTTEIQVRVPRGGPFDIYALVDTSENFDFLEAAQFPEDAYIAFSLAEFITGNVSKVLNAWYLVDDEGGFKEPDIGVSDPDTTTSGGDYAIFGNLSYSIDKSDTSLTISWPTVPGASLMSVVQWAPGDTIPDLPGDKQLSTTVFGDTTYCVFHANNHGSFIRRVDLDSTYSFTVRVLSGSSYVYSDTIIVHFTIESSGDNSGGNGGDGAGYGFEEGDFSDIWAFSGDAEWVLDFDEKATGDFSARSGGISHSQSSTMSFTVEVESGSRMSFWRKVSSEQHADYLEFYIDGVRQDRWSGTLDWSQVSYPVAPGTRTFRWTYAKDYLTSRGSDRAWIDGIVFETGGIVEFQAASFIPDGDIYGTSAITEDNKTLYYMSNGTLYSVDISDPENPVSGGSAPSNIGGGTVVIYNDILFASGANYMSVYDISSPLLPVVISADINIGTINDAVFTEDGSVFITAHDYGGIIFWDMSSTEALTMEDTLARFINRDYYDKIYDVHSILLDEESNILWVGHAQGISAVDVSDYSDPQQLAIEGVMQGYSNPIAVGQGVRSLHLLGRQLYGASNSFGIVLFDISDLSAITRERIEVVGFNEYEPRANRVTKMYIDPQTMIGYCEDFDDGLFIVDLSDSSNPELLATFFVPSGQSVMHSLAVSSDFTYSFLGRGNHLEGHPLIINEW